MKTRIITRLELVENRIIADCLRWGTFHLLGIPWKKKLTWWVDPPSGNIIIKYE